ncbi:MAG: hypothetical protein M1838_000457 [Thelocarpon superellum]|nr:MAG: hypothetical protein M1838_000457 [Thelocarpon superellum]
MPADDTSHRHQGEAGHNGSFRDFFAIPGPVKRLFDQFPLLHYPANTLPARSAPRGPRSTLYIFTTDERAFQQRPSFNPQCLKWQTFLKFSGVDFDTARSNNHASPTGALPFILLPPVDASTLTSRLPVPANKLHQWAEQHGRPIPDVQDLRSEAYQSLVDFRIMNAWLYALYLEPANADIARRLYIDPCSTNPLVRLTIAHQLRSAAQDELHRASPIINVIDTYREAQKAFDALDTLLGDHSWFFGEKEPGLFDASVFSYTHLLLSDVMGWIDQRLVDVVRGRPNLARHHERILAEFYGVRPGQDR